MSEQDTLDQIQQLKLLLSRNTVLIDERNNLGNLYKQIGQFDEAQACYEECLRMNNKFSAAWSNLAGVYKDRGDMGKAEEFYLRAIQLDPELVDAYQNLGNTYFQQTKLEDSVIMFRNCLQRRVSCTVDVYCNLANALSELKKLPEAIDAYQMCIKEHKSYAPAYNNMGNVYKDLHMVKHAVSSYKLAIHLDAHYAAPHSNLANLLKERGELDEALLHYKEAIRLDPDFVDAHNNMGNVLKDKGLIHDAMAAYQRAIQLNPNFATAYSNLASCYKDAQELYAAISNYCKALALRPFFPDAFCNMVHCLQLICDWASLQSNMHALEDILERQLSEGQTPSIQPFHAFVYRLKPKQIMDIAKAYARRIVDTVVSLNIEPYLYPSPGALRNGRLRIGYVSSDFGNHPLSYLMGGVFGYHDRINFEIFCYALTPDDNSVQRKMIESESEHFLDLSSMPLHEAASIIHNDHKIQILVNLNGYTKGARNELFALKPAPVQISYMGYAGTTGMPFIDYLVTDKWASPPEYATPLYYTERLVYMPHSYFVNNYKQQKESIDSIHEITRASQGLPEDAVVLCNFNQLYKIDSKVFAVWMSVLKKVPNTVLWLLRFPPSGEELIIVEAERHGVPRQRIIFTGVLPLGEHIKRASLADLFLDTPLCNAHTTGTDVLWAGVPVITLPEVKMSSRVMSSFCHAIGMPEMVVESFEDYEALAVNWASSRTQLNQLRCNLLERRSTSPLFDTRLWVKDFERALRLMWEHYESDTSPHREHYAKNFLEFSSTPRGTQLDEYANVPDRILIVPTE